MKIYDENNILIENPDLSVGRLVIETKKVTHKYVVTQNEQGHDEVIKEYPNGGKIVDWVVDIPEQGEWKTYDADGVEIETDIVVPNETQRGIEIPDIIKYYRYTLFTEAELKEIEKNKIKQQITDLKQMLANTDYIVVKIAEGAATWEDYSKIKEQRQAWRDEINRLEAEQEVNNEVE